MVTEETFQKLSELKLHAFARAFQEQLEGDDEGQLGFDERVGLMVDREWTERQARRLTRRLQQAKFRDQQACVEDVDYRHPRGLERATMRRLASCEWVSKRRNIVITGPTGCGKTYIACALAQKACREGHTAIYRRVPRLFNELTLARADGSYTRLLGRLAKADVLVLDDWGLAPLGDEERRDILEVIEDRHHERSTVVASQLPIKTWHTIIGDPTIADAILDRLVHNAHKVVLKGVSMRKKRSGLTKEAESDK